MMRDDTAAPMVPPTQGPQGERSKPEDSTAAQAVVACMDGPHASARRLVERWGLDYDHIRRATLRARARR